MPQVVVIIAEKTFRIACREGEEDHLTALAAKLDRRIADMRGAFGEIGDLSLTVMASIAMADELEAARQKAERLERQLGGEGEAGERETGEANADEDREEAERQRAEFTATMNEAAETLERIAKRLGSA